MWRFRLSKPRMANDSYWQSMNHKWRWNYAPTCKFFTSCNVGFYVGIFFPITYYFSRYTVHEGLIEFIFEPLFYWKQYFWPLSSHFSAIAKTATCAACRRCEDGGVSKPCGKMNFDFSKLCYSYVISIKLTDDLLLLGSLWLFRLFLRVSHDVPGGGKVLKHAEPMFLLPSCSFNFLLNMARRVRIKERCSNSLIGLLQMTQQRACRLDNQIQRAYNTKIIWVVIDFRRIMETINLFLQYYFKKSNKILHRINF